MSDAEAGGQRKARKPGQVAIAKEARAMAEQQGHDWKLLSKEDRQSYRTVVRDAKKAKRADRASQDDQ